LLRYIGQRELPISWIPDSQPGSWGAVVLGIQGGSHPWMMVKAVIYEHLLWSRPCARLCIYILSHLHNPTCRAGVITSILKIKKVRLREAKYLVCITKSGVQSCLILKPVLFSLAVPKVSDDFKEKWM
jgi:hypothetical protein